MGPPTARKLREGQPFRPRGSTQHTGWRPVVVYFREGGQAHLRWGRASLLRPREIIALEGWDEEQTKPRQSMPASLILLHIPTPPITPTRGMGRHGSDLDRGFYRGLPPPRLFWDGQPSQGVPRHQHPRDLFGSHPASRWVWLPASRYEGGAGQHHPRSRSSPLSLLGFLVLGKSVTTVRDAQWDRRRPGLPDQAPSTVATAGTL